MTPRYTRKTLPQALADTATWANPDLSGCSDEKRRRVDALTQVIKKYLRFECVTPLLKQLGLNHEQLLRALNRCTEVGADGRLVGWRALIKHLHINNYCRKKPVAHREYLSKGGYSGVLGVFWEQHPDLGDRFDQYLRTRRRDGGTPESQVTARQAHHYFLDLCREAKIGETEWPYSVESRGKCAIRNYVKAFNDAHYDGIVLAAYGEKAQAKSKTGTGRHSRVQARLPLDIVEIDEHKMHCIGSIGIPTPKGIRWVPIRRITILVAADRESEAILAYVVVFRREANANDLMALLGLLSRHWEPRKFSVPGLEYPAGAGFPSGLIPDMDRCGCAIIMLDNALIHLATPIIERARRMLGCALNFGPVRRFERRWLIESIFGRIEAAGIQRVASTTGSGPQDPSRQAPEKKAVAHHISAEAILDLVEVLFASFNAKAGRGNFAISPLDYLRSLVSAPESDFLLPTLPPRQPGDVDLDVLLEQGVIAGNRETGVRPYISYCGAKYTNEQLANRWDLLGRRVVKQVCRTNIQSFEAVLEGGMLLGTVRALGRWRRSPHSLEDRRLINAAMRAGDSMLAAAADPVAAWHKGLQHAALVGSGTASAPKTTAAASQLADTSSRQGVVVALGTPSPPLVPSRLSTAVAQKKLEVPERRRAIN